MRKQKNSYKIVQNTEIQSSVRRTLTLPGIFSGYHHHLWVSHLEKLEEAACVGHASPPPCSCYAPEIYNRKSACCPLWFLHSVHCIHQGNVRCIQPFTYWWINTYYFSTILVITDFNFTPNARIFNFWILIWSCLNLNRLFWNLNNQQMDSQSEILDDFRKAVCRENTDGAFCEWL